MLKFLLAIGISFTGYAQDLTQKDYDSGAKFGHGIFEMQSEHKIKRRKVHEDKINDMVSDTLAEPNGLPSAQLLDLTTARIIQRSVAALNYFGYEDDAKKIDTEYKTLYRSFYTDRFFGVSKKLANMTP